MGKAQARKMVLVGAFLLAVIAVYRNRQDGAEGLYRPLWGVGVVSMVLAVVADFVPQIAGPFAGLVVLGSLTNGGEGLIQQLLGTVAVTPSPGAAAHPDSAAGPRGPGNAAAPAVPSTADTRRGGR